MDPYSKYGYYGSTRRYLKNIYLSSCKQNYFKFQDTNNLLFYWLHEMLLYEISLILYLARYRIGTGNKSAGFTQCFGSGFFSGSTFFPESGSGSPENPDPIRKNPEPDP